MKKTSLFAACLMAGVMVFSFEVASLGQIPSEAESQANTKPIPTVSSDEETFEAQKEAPVAVKEKKKSSATAAAAKSASGVDFVKFGVSNGVVLSHISAMQKGDKGFKIYLSGGQVLEVTLTDGFGILSAWEKFKREQ